MVYLDTSCLLKLLFEEPESQAVRDTVDAENKVIVSSLTELEAEVQLKAAAVGGDVRIGQWRHYQARLAAMRHLDPFHFKALPAAVFSTAVRQHRRPQSVYCRTLDRLHLAAMEELGLHRLMTLDNAQAKAAKAMDFSVTIPSTP